MVAGIEHPTLCDSTVTSYPSRPRNVPLCRDFMLQGTVYQEGNKGRDRITPSPFYKNSFFCKTSS
jgi:hypothetical protein